MPFNVENINAYSGYLRSPDELKKSTSGGGCMAIAKYILNEKHGVVFGATYTTDFRKVIFSEIHDVSQLDSIRGTKYVETSKQVLSEDKTKSVFVFYRVRENLLNGTTVLFIGLACDCMALLFFLKKNKVSTFNLYLVDLVCHGVTYPIVHQNFVELLEKKHKSKITFFNVRYKKDHWTPPYLYVEFENGEIFLKEFYQTDYGYAFDKYTRSSCSKCLCKGENHVADITCGDYWGIKPGMDGYNANGVSVLLVKTNKGEEILKGLNSSDFTFQKVDSSFAIENNKMYYQRCSPPDKKWYDFDKNIRQHGLHYAVVHDLGHVKYFILHLLRLFLGGNRIAIYKKIVPSSLRKKIVRLLKKLHTPEY